MIIVHSELRPSPIHGLGVFLLQSVRAGEVVWRFDPLCDVIVPQHQLDASPEPFQAYMHHYGAMTAELDGRWLMCGDLAKFLNHSESPSLSALPWIDVAARDLSIGDELTIDYREMEGVKMLRPDWGIEK